MNILKKALLAASFAVSCGASMTAGAEMISTTYDASPNTPLISYSLFWDTTSFFADLTNLSANSFNPATDTILSATLSIRLKDDNAQDSESWKYTLGQGTKAQTYTGSNIPDVSQRQCGWIILFGYQCWNTSTAGSVTNSIVLNTDAIKDLQGDGKLKVTVEATSGDFYFDSATLQANVRRGGSAANAVPEPGTVALLGLGLLGALGLRRSRKS